MMRYTVISKQYWYLEPIQPKLWVGDTQVLLFYAQDLGHFWIAEEQKRKSKDFQKKRNKKSEME